MSGDATVNRPVWVDLASTDAEAARDLYSQLFGWTIEVSPEPEYGGYGRAKLQGRDVAGIGPTQQPGMPSAWSVYIGTNDADETARAVGAAGGTVVAPPFDVGPFGRMAVFGDPTGAFISVWQTRTMGGFQASGPGTYVWAELNARGLERATAFYRDVFGWDQRRSDIPGGPPYQEFLLGEDSVAGSMEMHAGVPPEVPSYWMPYFEVEDVEASFARAIGLGAGEMVSPTPYPGGHFAIVSDPQGATFGLMRPAAG
jgi:hypothetical protein